MNAKRWMALVVGGLVLSATTGLAWSATQDGPQGSMPKKPATPDQAKDQPEAKPEPPKPETPKADASKSESKPKRLKRLDREDGNEDEPGEPGRRFSNPQDMFSEMERMMRDLDHGLPDMRGFFGGRPFEFRFFDDDGQGGGSGIEGMGPGSQMTMERSDEHGQRKLELSVKQDGHVEAVVTREGKTEKIEAKSVADFKSAHGDLLDEFGVGSGGGRVAAKAPGARPRSAPQRLLPEGAAPGPRLGVRVTPVSEDLAAYLELDEGVGLMVREVVPDSLAARIGVQRNDVIVAANGEAVTDTSVIARALKSDASLEVIVIRKGARVTLRGAT